MSVFKAIPAILLTMPLAAIYAQSPWVVSRFLIYGDSGLLLYVGEPGGPLFEGLQALPRADELAELAIRFGTIQTTSPFYAQAARELGLKPDSSWALADDKGRCLLQGSEPPTAAALRSALDAAGVKSPIRILRDFPQRQTMARESMLARYSAKSNWQAIIEMQEWRWEATQNHLALNPAKLTENLWSEDMWFLLEACLRLKKDRESNELLNVWNQSADWGSVKQSTVELAKKCGKTVLAKQWGKP